MDLSIRYEREKDNRIVEELTRDAFWNLYAPGCVEHFVLHNMRNSPDFIPELDLVAQKDGRIVGHIIYTRGILQEDGGAKKEVISFGPLSVLRSLQKQGIGSALIKHSLKSAADGGYSAVFIYGDPRYYSRFGFRCAEKYDIKTSDGKFAVALLALELKPGALKNVSGRFIESPAFGFDESKFAEFESTFPFKEKAETESQHEFRIMVSLRY
jgi:putative acetyltransferase